VRRRKPRPTRPAPRPKTHEGPEQRKPPEQLTTNLMMPRTHRVRGISQLDRTIVVSKGHRPAQEQAEQHQRNPTDDPGRR